MEDVSIPGMPGFKKGQEVRVTNTVKEGQTESLYDVLVNRKHAKPIKESNKQATIKKKVTLKGEKKVSVEKKKDGKTIK